ncbi:MAG: hypothetical protein ONB33_15830, partial [candidate division KSB1 bacterium]|nr:hypothetical protein [candidate division KSB1 bacterium]
RGPIFIPDRIKRPFSFQYNPAAGRAGRITMTLAADTFSVDLTPEQRKIGASFDRFGLLNPRKGGKYVDVYFDDLTYVTRRAVVFQSRLYRQEITIVPYPKMGRKY